ncbi:CASP-like protein 1 [Phtheirospermum japonicum]|uniref:CASP-like protein n=1 Tax=Phtheirospermum japonicum TaxID=374723 RepID=A0A830BA13_9LAMI|nr:CASP-like protein 1 [Phtheirospermum japonicum]
MSSTEAQTSSAAAKAVLPPPRNGGAALADVVLRFLLFASCLVSVLVMVTSQQEQLIPISFPPYLITQEAKFKHSPAFVYFVIALSVAGIYAIITTLVSFFALFKPGCYHKLVSHFVIFDVLFLGIMAAATGAAGAVAYIGLRGNNHVQWRKICDLYDNFCKHIGSSIAISLIGSVVLTLLVILSIRSLSKRIPN